VNAFHAFGALFALWAIALAGLGITRSEFPRSRGQALVVGMLSVLLAVAAIGWIITGALEEEKEEGATARRPVAGEGGARTPRLSADPGGELRFDTRSLEARAVPVTIAMANPSSVPHNVSIERHGVNQEGETVGQGGRSTVRAELRPGEYDFYCSVPGHSGSCTPRSPSRGRSRGPGVAAVTIDRPRRRRFLRRGPEDRAPDREPSRTAETGRRELRLAGRPGRG
jgi:plastocyanin